MTDMEREQLLEILSKQEQTLCFEKFDASDAWEIGCAIRNSILNFGGSATIDITCNDICLFSCCVPGVTHHNLTWIARKRNTVQEYWQSSYHVSLDLERMGKTFEQRGLSSQKYAASGGGFPIRLQKSGVIGAIVVSGLPQTHDHQFIVDVLCSYLKKQVSSIFDVIKI